MNKLTTALGATTLAAATMLSGCGSTPTSAPADPPATAPAVTPAASTHAAVLGPTGYGPLTLGMSYRDARATGQVADGSRGTHLAGHPDAGLCLSRADGLMAIFLGRGMRTSEGLRLGSSAARLRHLYPALTPYGVAEPGHSSGIFRAPAGAGDWYEIDVDHRHVSVVILRRDRQTCFE
ncbi:hypothetical protein [Nocardioides ultimimeridianus]